MIPLVINQNKGCGAMPIRLDQSIVDRIYFLNAEGATKAQIAQKLSISQPTVRRWLERPKSNHNAATTNPGVVYAAQDSQPPNERTRFIKWIINTTKFTPDTKVSLISALLD
jgi:hypothetical protein